jgi:hypothetical protein
MAAGAAVALFWIDLGHRRLCPSLLRPAGTLAGGEGQTWRGASWPGCVCLAAPLGMAGRCRAGWRAPRAGAGTPGAAATVPFTSLRRLPALADLVLLLVGRRRAARAGGRTRAMPWAALAASSRPGNRPGRPDRVLCHARIAAGRCSLRCRRGQATLATDRAPPFVAAGSDPRRATSESNHPSCATAGSLYTDARG